MMFLLLTLLRTHPPLPPPPAFAPSPAFVFRDEVPTEFVIQVAPAWSCQCEASVGGRCFCKKVVDP